MFNINGKKRIQISPKTALAILGALCAVLIVLSYIFPEFFAPVKSAVGYVVTPMQKGITLTGGYISDGLELLTEKQKLLEENESLREQLAEVRNENQMLVQEKYELNWYRELYELDSNYEDYEKVAARVISKETNSYYSVFTIDKGRDDGITVDMNVIAGNGLVGLVTETGKNWAKVRSIIDDKSNVSGMMLATGDTCVVSGNLELIDYGCIDVSMISPNADIYDNYEVVTSYISDKYLPGILIGYISDIVPDSSGMTLNAHLTPVVDFEHLDAVLIITRVREQMED